MWRLRSAILVSIAWAGVLLGCGGGSGSSGFDAIAAENAAIETALATGRCVRAAATTLQVCPLGEELPEYAPAGVVVRSPDGVAVSCAPRSGTCMGEVELEFAGAATGTVAVLALRDVERDGPWQIVGPVRAASPTPVAVGFTVPAWDAGGALGPGDLVQIAILIFRKPVGILPEVVPTLAATGAHTAFVSFPTQATVAGELVSP